MGYVLNGKFYKGAVPLDKQLQKKTSVWKQSNHDQQRADHQGDLIQPYLRDGNPNPAFIEYYPEESQTAYNFAPTDDDIAREK